MRTYRIFAILAIFLIWVTFAFIGFLPIAEVFRKGEIKYSLLLFYPLFFSAIIWFPIFYKNQKNDWRRRRVASFAKYALIASVVVLETGFGDKLLKEYQANQCQYIHGYVEKDGKLVCEMQCVKRDPASGKYVSAPME